jgi:hypothetical protein
VITTVASPRLSMFPIPLFDPRSTNRQVRRYYPLERNSKNAVLRIVAVTRPGLPKASERSTTGERRP